VGTPGPEAPPDPPAPIEPIGTFVIENTAPATASVFCPSNTLEGGALSSDGSTITETRPVGFSGWQATHSSNGPITMCSTMRRGR
jgi:hypothetical protein